MKVNSAVTLALMFTTGCSPVENTVAVDVGESPNAFGVIYLCGKTVPLNRRGERLTGTVPITCEGSGEVRLTLTNGDEITCPIGYVTIGAEQHFDFSLKRGECV